MNFSSLLTGIVIGAAATNMISKNNQNGAVGQQLADKARGKMMDFTGMGSILGSDRESESPTVGSNFNSTNETFNTTGIQTQTHSKESNMTMLKDFIKGNPEVKYEVDQILKETNTVIPGL
ncbi:hypothetical protein [Paenibacillus crassostreae]|uniref:Uncharacterized protein n=1 Tax=Paenibacillus crassostreae TaxID=1763538 RepID=A0A162RSG9_9BACL|nr:hypothetical protein [Paenibacillus crassostreae]OAB74447.1 hypothetical protein PNBC_10275 [Paenibacillus crassostreae]